MHYISKYLGHVVQSNELKMQQLSCTNAQGIAYRLNIANIVVPM